MKNTKHWLITGSGIALLAVGFFLMKNIDNSNNFLMNLPYAFVGIGSGVFGSGMGSIVTSRTLKKHPETQRVLEIEKKDERNIAISNRAKAKAYDAMTFVFGALMVSFALMGIELVAVLLLVFSYLFVHGYGIYYRCKYDREM